MEQSSSILESEQAYSVYAMHFISLCSHALQSKPGLVGNPVVDMCARIEDCIYNKALTAAGNPPALWHSDTAPIFYRELCESAMRCLEDNSANIDWRKMYNESKKNIDPIYKYILSRSDSSLGGGGGGGGKSKKNSLYANSKFHTTSKKNTKQVGFSSTNLGSMANKPPSQMQMTTSVSTGNFISAASTNSLSFTSNNIGSNYSNSNSNSSVSGAGPTRMVDDTSSSSILRGNDMELNEMESISLDKDMLEPMSPVSSRHQNENSQSSSSSYNYNTNSNNTNSFKNSASSDNLQELQQQQIALDQAREEARKKREEQLNVMINPSLLNLDDDDGFF